MVMNRESAQPSLDAIFQQAIALHQAGRLPDALEAYQHVIGHIRQYVEAFLNAGSLLERFGQLAEALQNYDAAIALQPAIPDSHCLRGNLLFRLHRFDEALAAYERAISLCPGFPEALLNRGLLLAHLGRVDEALSSYTRAIESKPDYLGAHLNRGQLLKELRRFDEALASYEQALRIDPNAADVHNNRGILLGELRQREAALASYRQAIALRPDHADAHLNLGVLLAEFDQVDEALASYDRALAIRPDYPMALNNKAILLKECGRFAEAQACCERALRLQPDFAEAQYTRAELLLLTGDYARGWPLFEARWQSRYRPGTSPLAATPLWTGEPLAGKTLLIEPEVGFGDQIMFARYARLAEQQGARVLLLASAPLCELFTTLGGAITVLEDGHGAPLVDFRCPIMSLPHALRTMPDRVPAAFPYLGVPAARRALWRGRLGAARAPRIGLVWSGAADRYQDRNPRTARSLSLAALAPLLCLPFAFHALHKEIAPGDAEVLGNFPALTSHAGELSDFADTAALIGEMDLVIAVDTAVAHLAGALGKPLWVMLPWATDYRWQASGETTPWYPAARLFRQSRAGDWEGVVERVGAALADEFGVNARLR